MPILFPVTYYLYLYETSIDLYLKPLREAIDSIPRGNLKIEESCYPIIIDYQPILNRRDEEMSIHLSYGFHHSDFERNHPFQGLVLCVNPPSPHKIRNIKIPSRKSIDIPNLVASFSIGLNRFHLTSQEFNLDEVACNELSTGKKHEKPRKLQNSDQF